MLRRLITATALAAVPLVGLSVPATAAATVPAARIQVQTPPRPCPAGYAEWYITSGGFKYYLDAEGLGAAVEVTNTPTCWHAPGNLDSYGTFKDNSGNCLDWDQSAGEVVMAKCDGAVSENWDPYTFYNALVFQNEYSSKHNLSIYWLAANMFAYGSIVSLSGTENGLDAWFKS